MRRNIILIIFFLLVANALKAQYYDDSPQLMLSMDVAFPLNDPSKIYYYPGIGGTAKFTFPAGDYSDFVLSGSLTSFFGKDAVRSGKPYKARKRNMAVALLGYRRYLSPLSNYNTWYIEPHAGLTLDGTKHQAFTLGASLGYLINNKIDIAAKYQSFGGTTTNSLSFIGLSLGYGIGLR